MPPPLEVEFRAAPTRLRVSPNRRFLCREDGAPFFYLGDTAWELFHRLSREDADFYLRDRAAKGFNVVQAVALAEHGGLTEPNPYGALPLHDLDPARPNAAYFEHVDWIVNRAAELGLMTGFLPTWGDKVGPILWGQGPEIFTPDNARSFGRFLGERYRAAPIIWMLGGDRNPEAPQLAIWRALAQGLREGDGGAHLQTYHPRGPYASSEFVHEEAWLDFNTFQSGHATKETDGGAMMDKDYALLPVKPSLDSEPCYEDHPVRRKPEQGWFDAADARRAAYRALCAGACGHTYGAHSIWQFWEPKRFKPIGQARTPWRQALQLSGAGQMQFARRLFESRPFFDRVPDQSLLVGDQGEGAARARATRAANGSYAFAFVPFSQAVKVDVSRLAAPLRAWWFDPRDGSVQAGDAISGGSPVRFEPPSRDDWVLVLDDESREFGKPGATESAT